MWIEFFKENVLIPVVTAVITWFFARRQKREQLKSMELDNEIKSANYYKDLLDDMAKRLDKALEEIAVLEQRYRDLLNNHNEVLQTNKSLIEELKKFKQLNGKSK